MRITKPIAGWVLLVIALVTLASLRPKPERTIEGNVIDAATKQPLTGAIITDKGKRKSVSTDQQGHFKIAVEGDVTLECAAVGYSSVTKQVKEKTNTVDFALSATAALLEDVVVTGYATQKRMEVTGSVSTLSAPISGRVAGVQVHRRNKAADRFADEAFNTEGYSSLPENKFLSAPENPLSTFSIDVDAASYSNLRRFLQQGQLPPAGVVRSEELINYFNYDYAGPVDQHPFAIHTELFECPWATDHQLVSIGLQGKKIPVDNLPASNLVFLIDVSGSMMDENKLPLVKASLKLLVDQLREQDHVSLVVYAGSAGVVLQPTSGADKMRIKSAIDALEAGGSTAGGAGIQLAYKLAREHYRENGNNRVILCTDGDFNVGASSDAAMEKLIEKERESGVFLTVLGYGMGNYQDAKMQLLADKGNGNHAYIDGMQEARKVLVNEFGGTLFTIAKDVKLQIEFNPAQVQAYRLIGYENRLLAKEDFNNDKKDAGDMGSGHTVTALYEIIPVGVENAFDESVDPLKYSKPVKATANTNDVMQIKLRYKQPDGNKSQLLQLALNKTDRKTFKNASENARFASAVAAWGMLLNHSEYVQNASYRKVLQIAENATGTDKEGYRKEFIELVKKSERLADMVKE